MTAVRQAAKASPWILSPLWDTLLFIGAPLTAIAALYPLRVYWQPEAYAFLLLAFFTFGHHLPGFLRAYGDRELFRRFRWRFLLAPPLAFGLTLWFDSRALHGFFLLVFAWDIWHVLMQHYGFMRIYDAKQGVIGPRTARLDWALSITWYILLIVASPHYRHNMLQQAYTSGIPLLSASVVETIEVGLWIAAGGLTVAYAVHHYKLWQEGKLNWRKLATLGTFLFASYYLYVVVADFIVGFAVWSAFHCIQYYGIVWVFNRNRLRQGDVLVSGLRRLFEPRALMILLYVALIAAYGGINFTQRMVSDENLRRLLLAFIATSNILHYYYDGFIWKVRDKETRKFLEIEAGGESAGQRVRRLLDWLKPTWDRPVTQAAYLFAVLAILAGLEIRRPNDEVAMRRVLAASAPQASEAQLRLAETLRQSGQHTEAVDAYRRAVMLDPMNALAHVNLGVSAMASGQVDEAIAAYERALMLNPGIAAAHFNLASLLAARGDIGRAQTHFRYAAAGNDPDAKRLAEDALREIAALR